MGIADATALFAPAEAAAAAIEAEPAIDVVEDEQAEAKVEAVSTSEVQVTFLQNGTKSLSKFTSENLKNKRLEDRCLAGGVISDIHRVLWVSVDPVDVRNDSQQGTCPQAVCNSNFLM